MATEVAGEGEGDADTGEGDADTRWVVLRPPTAAIAGGAVQPWLAAGAPSEQSGTEEDVETSVAGATPAICRRNGHR